MSQAPFDAVVVGAGLAGAVLAERLAQVAQKRVLVVEKRSHLGGNCYDEKDEAGILVHRYGPHLFHTDNKAVMDYLRPFADWIPYFHKVKAHIDGIEVPLPFNFRSMELLFDAATAQRVQSRLVERFGYGAKVPILELQKSADRDLIFLAEFVYEKVFLHYTLKQWGLRPDEIDKEVTARVPVLVGRDERYFQDRYQFVPADGYGALIKKMLTHPRIKWMLQTDFLEIAELKEGKISLFGAPFEGTVFYTGALDELFDYRWGALPYRSVQMAFETLPMPRYQVCATVNYPNQFDFTRITEFKHIHPVTVEKTTVLKEYPCAHIPGKTIPYYPVFTDKNRALYARYAQLAKTYGQFVPVGRLAEYRYYDMDDAVARALDVFKEYIG